MQKTTGIITNQIEGDILGEIGKNRSINTLPFGARYRLIDFALSNMVNSGIKNIGVIANNKYSTLIQHLGTGQEWSLSRKSNDLKILDGGRYLNIRNIPEINLTDFINNYDFLKNSTDRDVLITSSDIICNINYEDGIKTHIENNADITMFYKPIYNHFELNERDSFFEIDKNSKRIVNITKDLEQKNKNQFMYVLIIKRELLLSLINSTRLIKQNIDLIDFIKNSISGIKVKGYEYNGYFTKINSIKKYYAANMDLLDDNYREKLLLSKNRIYTRILDNHPTRYLEHSKVRKSCVGSGCILNGEIENSIIFRQVYAEKGSRIKNSIIMKGCVIGKGAALENVILDTDVIIGEDIILKGKQDMPVIISKGTVIG